MTERERDLWAERRDELAQLVASLTPLEALAVLRMVIEECPEGHLVAPVLAGRVRGMLERRNQPPTGKG